MGSCSNGIIRCVTTPIPVQRTTCMEPGKACASEIELPRWVPWLRELHGAALEMLIDHLHNPSSFQDCFAGCSLDAGTEAKQLQVYQPLHSRRFMLKILYVSLPNNKFRRAFGIFGAACRWVHR